MLLIVAAYLKCMRIFLTLCIVQRKILRLLVCCFWSPAVFDGVSLTAAFLGGRFFRNLLRNQILSKKTVCINSMQKHINYITYCKNIKLKTINNLLWTKREFYFSGVVSWLDPCCPESSLLLLARKLNLDPSVSVRICNSIKTWTRPKPKYKTFSPKTKQTIVGKPPRPHHVTLQQLHHISTSPKPDTILALYGSPSPFVTHAKPPATRWTLNFLDLISMSKVSTYTNNIVLVLKNVLFTMI